jgi:hypothetical protein
MYLLSKDVIEGWWPMVAPLLSKAWDTTQIGALMSLSDVRDKLESGVYHCFISSDKSYSGVFSIAQSPKCRYLKFFLSGGQEPSDGWEAVDKFLREVSQVFGCSRIYLEGRVGWKRKVEPLGYTVDSLLMTKEVL